MGFLSQILAPVPKIWLKKAPKNPTSTQAMRSVAPPMLHHHHLLHLLLLPKLIQPLIEPLAVLKNANNQKSEKVVP